MAVLEADSSSPRICGLLFNNSEAQIGGHGVEGALLVIPYYENFLV